jgi:hypothetical protein
MGGAKFCLLPVPFLTEKEGDAYHVLGIVSYDSQIFSSFSFLLHFSAWSASHSLPLSSSVYYPFAS